MDEETEAQGAWKLAQVHKASEGHGCDWNAVLSPSQKLPMPWPLLVQEYNERDRQNFNAAGS